MNKSFLVALVIFTFFSTKGNAQEATLEETLAWLKGKIESSDPISKNAEHPNWIIGYYRFNYTGCEIEYSYEQHYHVKNGLKSSQYLRTTQKFNLKDIANIDFYEGKGTAYQIDFGSLRLNILWKQKLVKVWSPVDNAFLRPKQEKDAITRSWLDISHPEALRLKKAFDHAVKLCDGGPKEEKF